MSDRVCVFCDQNNIIDNKCLSCNSIVLKTENKKQKYDLESSEHYNDVLSIIHQKTNLSKELISILLKLNSIFINLIMSVVIEYKDKYPIFHIKEDFTLVENFNKSIQYILATYLLHNKNFKINDINYNNDFFREEIYLVNKSKKNKQHLSISNNDIILRIEHKYNDSIPYNINLLNKEERKKFLNILYSQTKLINNSNYEEIDKQTYQYVYININLNNDLNQIHKDIDNFIDKIYEEIINKLNDFKEYNKQYFQRALHEKEIENF